MSKDVLLSVKPKYVELIKQGVKRWEFRRRIWKQPVNYVYIYASAPVKRIVGRFKIGKYSHIDIDAELWLYELWNYVKDQAGVSKEEYLGYFENAKYAYAIEISELEIFKVPVSPKWFLCAFNIPQNFRYLNYLESDILHWCFLPNSENELLEIEQNILKKEEAIKNGTDPGNVHCRRLFLQSEKYQKQIDVEKYVVAHPKITVTELLIKKDELPQPCVSCASLRSKGIDESECGVCKELRMWKKDIIKNQKLRKEGKL